MRNPCFGLCLVSMLTIAATSARAADVSAVVKKGDLVITGGAANDSFTIDQFMVANSKQFRLHGGGATTINGSSSDVFVDGVKRDVKIDLGDGSNSISFGPSAIARDLRVTAPSTGAISLSSFQIKIKRDVSFRTNGATGFASFSSVAVGRDIKFVTGNAGGDGLTLSGGTAVGRDVRVDTGDGGSSISANDTNIRGRFSVKSGAGSDSVSLSVVMIDGDASVALGSDFGSASWNNVRFGRNVKFTSGAASDSFSLSGSSIDGDARLDFGEGGIGSNINNTRIRRSLRVTGGSAADSVTLDQNSLVGGAARFDFGAGVNNLQINAAQLGSLRATFGSDKDTVQCTSSTVIGQARLELGGSTSGNPNSISLFGDTMFGDVVFVGGSSDDSFNASSTDIYGALRATLGDGPNQFFVGTTQVDSVRVTGGGGVDTMSFNGSAIAGDVFLDLDEGVSNNCSLSTNEIGKGLTIRAGAGDDSVSLSQTSVLGKQKIQLGAGMNTGP